MSQVEQGRHCAKCVKTVYDVSNWSDEKILTTYEQKNHQMCIRIPKDRLEQEPAPTKWYSRFKYAVLAGIASFWLMVKSNFAKAQAGSTANTAQTNPDTMQNVETSVQVNGIVMDSIDRMTPISYASIVIRNGETVLTGGLSRNDGSFELKLDSVNTSDTLTVEVQYVGFETVAKTFTPNVNDTIRVDVYMKEEHICLNEHTIVLNRPDRGHFSGIPTITMGVMVGERGRVIYKNGKPLLDEYDTKTYHHDELQRYNLGR